MNKIIFFLLFLFSASAFSQVNDAGLWASFNAEKKITQALSVNISEEFRMNENFSELGTFFTDGGLTYKINNNIRVSGNYRFTNKRQLDDSYTKRHRYYFDLTLREKAKPFIVQFRTRFQSQYADVYSSPEGKIPSNYSRNKLSIKFDLDKKYSPYISTELFTPLDPAGLYIDNARYSAGLTYDINRIHSLDIFYMIQQEYNVNDPERDFIVGIGYYYTFQ